MRLSSAISGWTTTQSRTPSSAGSSRPPATSRWPSGPPTRRIFLVRQPLIWCPGL
jgi:hypothetical protein